MALKWKELELLLEQAAPTLCDAAIQKIQQTEKVAMGESLVLTGFGPRGPWRLWLCLLQGMASCGFLSEEERADSMSKPSTFVMVLRKHLLGNPIRKLEQVPYERIFLIHFHSGHSLVCELLPKRANVVLLDQWDSGRRRGRHLGAFRQVSLESGGFYEIPPPPPPSEALVRDEFKGSKELPALAARWFWARATGAEDEAERRAWRQSLKSARKKIAAALENAKKDLEEARAAEEFQKWGKILFGKLYELGPRNYPSGKFLEAEGLQIKVDPSRTWSENAEAFFKKSKKYNRATEELGGRVKDLEKKLATYDLVGAKLDEASVDFELLEQEFRAGGIPLPKKEAAKKSDEPKPFLEVTSEDGFSIYCGRNQEENRRVTFHESKGGDVWLHVKGIPGAHVVIKSQKNKTVPLTTLIEGAQLAIYYSKIRSGEKTEVDYTFRKNVKAIKGTLAEVTYTGNKTLVVTPDPELVKRAVSRT